MTRPTRVGVVTIAHGRHAHLHAQHLSLAAGTRRPDHYLVVAMDDPAIVPATYDGLPRDVVRVDRHPLGLPLAAARNRGLEEMVRAGVDVVVFLDVDCLAGADLVASYADVVGRRPDAVWSGPVTYLAPPPVGGYDLARLPDLDDPHPARPAPAPGTEQLGGAAELFWSLSFAVTPATWRRVGGFCTDYVGYGGEDTDFGRLTVAAGIQLGWVGGARAYHQHHPVSSPPVEHVDDVLRNGRTYYRRWGEWPMLGWLRDLEQLGLVRRTDDWWERTTGLQY